MSNERAALGAKGEEDAVSFLQSQGYKILHRNYRNRFGEIDIIASDKDILCFVEVKTRRSSKFGAPQEALSKFKISRISKAALGFLKERKFLDREARFDVVSIVCAEDSVKPCLIKNAFELDSRFNY